MSIEAEARAFWQSICEARALHCERNAAEYRAMADTMPTRDEADDASRMRELHIERAAWLRACARAA